MKLERIALQVARSADEAAAVLLQDNPDFFSRLAEEDLAQIASYVAKSVHHGKPIVRISLQERRFLRRAVWPTTPFPIPTDLIRCVLIRPVGIALKHISLRQPLLWHYDMRLDLDLLKNKTQSEVWGLVRQLTLGKSIVTR
jgi:hypothetical protein